MRCGITEVDPDRMSTLFERFVSRERNEPPDIDVDFEHQRREEVIQYVYRKYSRERAALAATVICYRTKSALRDVGKALGMPLDEVDRARQELHILGPEAATGCQRTLLRARRHAARLSAPPVAACRRLRHLARAARRAGADRECGDARAQRDPVGQGRPGGARPAESGRAGAGHAVGDPAGPGNDLGMEMHAGSGRRIRRCTRMIQKADTIGVFQIESRAQMSMLPRLRPASFYDLVIEVAIVRPGPIQGGMVHPYLRRRRGEEPVAYPSDGGEAGPGTNPGRADFPGAGDGARHGGGRLHARRGRPAAPLDGGVEASRPRWSGAAGRPLPA